MERLLRHPAMARCENCRSRFPYPGRRARDPEALGAVAAEPRSAEEEKAPKMTKENTQVQAPQQGAPTDTSFSDMPRCPACGSTKHHRTERSTLERMLGRPPMARCEKCGKRFPYSKPRVGSPDSKPSGQTSASRGRMRGERSGSGSMEGTAQPRADNAGSIADSSEEESSRCPFCGSTAYRRSRRTTAERLLLRPKMARCSHCRKRFPFPLR
jgi:DNA-directed RNA polymerase subunit M/transcription elongation factor TFIIS